MARLSARRARTSMRRRALDARDRIAGRGGRLMPPRRLQRVGDGPSLPEEAAAYEPECVLEALRAAGLDLVALRPGTWTGREEGLSPQDVVVARA